MPGLSPSDINLVDTSNSSTTPLAALAFFTGDYTDVTSYSSLSVSVLSDVSSTFSGLSIEWSTDGINNDIAPQSYTFDPSVVSQDGFTVHATVRARFCRIVYQNNVTPQTFFTLTTLLRKGTPSGTVRTVDPVNTFTTNLDVQVVQSLTSGLGLFNTEQVQIASIDDVDPPDGFFLFTSPRPGKNLVIRDVTPVSLVPVDLVSVGLPRCTFFSITNSVTRGNLFIRLGTGTGLTITDYDYKIPPGHTWQDPGQFGSVYPDHIFGVWDEAYIQSPTEQLGNAIVVRNFYG